MYPLIISKVDAFFFQFSSSVEGAVKGPIIIPSGLIEATDFFFFLEASASFLSCLCLLVENRSRLFHRLCTLLHYRFRLLTN